MRIGFENFGGPAWPGGSSYLSNLLRAVRIAGDSSVRLIVFHRADAPVSAEVADVADAVVRQPDAPGRRRLIGQVVDAVRLRAQLPTGRRDPLDGTLRSHGVDVYFSQFDSALGLSVPLLAWIADFQHRHLPAMFSPEELDWRDRVYRAMGERAGAVVLSSDAARADFERFAPEWAHKARVLRFVATIPDSAYAADPADTVAKYHLPRRFFYMPNQLWKHKNFELVIDALALLKRQGGPVPVVVHTGNTNDYRNPTYAAHVLGRIAEAGVREAVVMLGLVPRADLYNLYRGSVAVLQPSRFEGWSTSVEECKSIGKRMVLSDLPVHREQAPPGAVYFPPESAEVLAERMGEVWASAEPGPEVTFEEAARAVLAERVIGFGRTFLEIAKAVV